MRLDFQRHFLLCISSVCIEGSCENVFLLKALLKASVLAHWQCILSDDYHPFFSSMITFSKSFMYLNKTHCFGYEFIVHESLSQHLVNFIHFTPKISKKNVFWWWSEGLLNVLKTLSKGSFPFMFMGLWPMNINFEGNPCFK